MPWKRRSGIREEERELKREGRETYKERERKRHVKCLLQGVEVGCIPSEPWP